MDASGQMEVRQEVDPPEGLTRATMTSCQATKDFRKPEFAQGFHAWVVGSGPAMRRGRTTKWTIDLPDVVAEVSDAFERYEKALVSNDVPTLNELFRDDPRTIRYGANEILYGAAEIKSFRGARSPVALGRTRSRTVITTYGRDFRGCLDAL